MRAGIRERGHAVTHGGIIPGIIQAAPVFAANDPPPLAISVVLPESIGTPEHLAEVTSELHGMVKAASGSKLRPDVAATRRGARLISPSSQWSGIGYLFVWDGAA